MQKENEVLDVFNESVDSNDACNNSADCADLFKSTRKQFAPERIQNKRLMKNNFNFTNNNVNNVVFYSNDQQPTKSICNKICEFFKNLFCYGCGCVNTRE